ncbi:hypothetical protein D1159_09215 [Pseudoflavonifractor sp. 524-17]|uniref:hypothetical protein n=1 Tax=Pseudoflavonifractor sp. 524-17 TaxID=2304577 RepID=UPI00137AE695|nr:hypothetical protein [Pseudoflavonifractor sp. 524-17]NCE64763.1 hypothetical protein [Pseudoflavonifractor sp. 524-17]
MDAPPVIYLEAWKLTQPETAWPRLCQTFGLAEGEEPRLEALRERLAQGEALGVVLIGGDLLRRESWGKRLLGALTQAANENSKLHLVFRD